MCKPVSVEVVSSRQTLSEKVRQFTPNWFAMTMGNGIVSLVFAGLPLGFAGPHAIAATLWGVNVALYAACFGMLMARVIRHPETIRPMLHHPLQSMFLGAIPMGLVPIINGWVLFAAPHIGAGAYTVAYYLWWFDSLLAVAIAIGVPYLMFTEQSHAFERLSAVLLLPLVGPEVAASSAAVIAPHLPIETARMVIGVGYALWAVSLSLAFAVLTIVFFRLVIHKLPHRDLAPSSWLTLGPIGTGALGILGLGQASRAAFQGSAFVQLSAIASELGVACALLLWSAGVWWFVIAMLFTLRYRKEGMQFNLGWWGFTFPLGVYTAATLALHRATGIAAFGVLGTMLAMLLGGFWIVVLSKTIRCVLRDQLFQAPCLASMRPGGYNLL
ncbi:C4-dicarboxylate transporter/malic acid transport protein [Burkholderia ambifaria MEX-5]|uniref:C4-dicarboxylate transporter/malic acid transport protein n=2 Tax=Burkholderia ambifaria TaxID=152480 RepID=B1T1G0_9BURK|nr:C4-dicarboxylate transporter/malic acid transport protein [Burkholderia ambifaria MEX-5]